MVTQTIDNPEVQGIINKYSQSKKYYQVKRDDAVKHYKQYRSILDLDSSKDYYKWRSKLFIPATARAVDGLLPDLLLTLFMTQPFFTIEPREAADVDQAKLMEILLSYQFENANFFIEFYDFILQLAIYGTTFGKVYWKTDKRTITRKKKKEFLGVQIGPETTEREEITLYDDPIFESIDFFDIFIAPCATCLSDTWVIHRSEKTLGECKQLAKQGIYQNVDKLESIIMSEVDTNRTDSMERKLVQGLAVGYGAESGDRRRIEILEYWNQDRTKTATIGGQSVLLKPMRNNPTLDAGAGVPIDPFVSVTLWPVPKELYGIGIAEKAKDLNDQLNSEVNQRLDNRNLKQNQIVKVRRGANVNVRNIMSKPGAIWLTDDMTAIDPVVVPDVASPSSFQEESLLKQEIEEITGVTKYATGSSSASRRTTATEASILTRMGSKGFALMIKRIEEQAMKPIVEKFYQLDQLYMDDERSVRIAGIGAPSFVKIPPMDLGKTFDVTIQASSQLMDKNLKAQQMINFYQMNMQNPTVQTNLLRKIYELWGEKDFEQLQIAPEPIGVTAPPVAAPLTATAGGVPVPPTGVRPGTEQEGGIPLPTGGGGTRPI